MMDLVTTLAPMLLFLEGVILVLLLILGVAIVAIFSWRLLHCRKQVGDAGKWMKILSKDIADPGTSLAGVVEDEFANVPGRLAKTMLSNPGLAPEALQQVLEVQLSAEKRELEKGLAFLGTVGANAPFIGLTGTVLGILTAFDSFAASGGSGSSEVMSAISRSLVATAAGLMVAIPAVIFHNILRSRVRSILEKSKEVGGMVMARSLQAWAVGAES